jgi:hypothetical protein
VKTARNFAASIRTSVAVSVPFPVGYWYSSSAVVRTLSFERPTMSPRTSPLSGANAAT